MKYLITGAGQIGTELVSQLANAGHDVVVLRRGGGDVPAAMVVRGDAGIPDHVRSAADGATAIFHCVHAAYSAKAWRGALFGPERAAMDVAAELGIPVVFPESVYPFGAAVTSLGEDTPIAPASPLGEIRAELLAARAAHPAATASVVASDLVGPTVRPFASFIESLVIAPVVRGRRAWVMGNPDAPHAATYVPDLVRGMIAAAELARPGGTLLMAPTAPARSQRQMANDVVRLLADAVPGTAPDAEPRRARVSSIPRALFALAGLAHPMARELHHQGYLWARPNVLRPGRLTTELGIAATPWDRVLAETVGRLAPTPAAAR